MTSKINESRMLNSTKQQSPNNSASKDENDRLFDALVSGKKPSTTNTDSAKKKFILADKTSKSQKSTNNAEMAKAAKAAAAVASNLSPRQTNSSPRASPRHYGSSATCPSPSASPRQDSGSSPRHHQSSAPRYKNALYLNRRFFRISSFNLNHKWKLLGVIHQLKFTFCNGVDC